MGDWGSDIAYGYGFVPIRKKKNPVFVAAVASWQVPSSHNFRLMDPLGYAAGEAQFVDGSWMVGQTVPVPKASPLEAALVATEDRSFHGFGWFWV